MIRRLGILILLTGIAGLVGCGTPFKANVDAIAAPSSSSYRSYVLLSGKEGVTTSDLNFREYATIVDAALHAKGYRKVQSLDTAEIAVFLNYGVSDPKTTPYVRSVPMYGQIGGGTTYHSGSIYGGGGSATYSGSSYQAPQYGIVGSSTYAGTVTTYYRFLRLDAVDVKKYRQTDDIMPIWKATVLSGGSSGDLRPVFPYLVVACMDYVGKNTGKSISVKVGASDKRVKVLVAELER